ncbi:MAG: exodeoxyribonuclease VII small subunit [Deltaproteobacteria bacterium]|nr:exodeoxyribonuclease VII small subunit [Deltaproteobacteria bacterium]
MTSRESLPYQKMMGEVESLLSELSSPHLDLDQMVVKVEKGYALINEMRDRLNAVKGKIEKLHAEYADQQTSDKAPPSENPN